MDHPIARATSSERLALALEHGDWRRLKCALGSTSAVPVRCGRDEVHLLAAMFELAESMRLQTAGQVKAAQVRVAAAQRIVGQLAGSIEPGQEPARHRENAHVLWRVVRVAWREQAELETLRRTFSESSRGRRELVLATVEFLTFVEFDPWSCQAASSDARFLGLGPRAFARFGIGNRLDTCRRATELRHLGNGRTGSVSDKIWQHISGGYWGLRAEAFRRLESEPLRRWHGHEQIPVRRGRENAWQFAQLVRRDIQAS